MEIVRTLLFLFVVNNSVPATNPMQLKKNILGKWRVIEVVVVKNTATTTIHQKMVYRFLEDGIGYAEFGTSREQFRWKMEGQRIMLSKQGSRKKFFSTAVFVTSTAKALQIIKKHNTKSVAAILLVRGMPDIDK